MALTAISGFELFTRRAKIRRMEKKNFAKWNTLKSKPTLLDCSTQLICQAEPHNQPRDQNIATMQRKNVFECWILLSIDRKVSSIFPYSMSFFHSVWEHSRALSRPSKIYQGFLNSIIHKTTNILKSSIKFHAPWSKLSILQKKKSRFLFKVDTTRLTYNCAHLRSTKKSWIW